MVDPHAEAILNEALTHEARSFLAYVSDAATPLLISERDREVGKTLEEILASEEKVLERLLGEMERVGGRAEVVGHYDLRASHYNFIEAAFLVKVVEEKLAESVEGFRSVVEKAAGDPALSVTLRGILRDKETQLDRIRELLPGGA